MAHLIELQVIITARRSAEIYSILKSWIVARFSENQKND